jgi:hypothetical protein
MMFVIIVVKFNLSGGNFKIINVNLNFKFSKTILLIHRIQTSFFSCFLHGTTCNFYRVNVCVFL